MDEGRPIFITRTARFKLTQDSPEILTWVVGDGFPARCALWMVVGGDAEAPGDGGWLDEVRKTMAVSKT
jgi:hypothetical protein